MTSKRSNEGETSGQQSKAAWLEGANPNPLTRRLYTGLDSNGAALDTMAVDVLRRSLSAQLLPHQAQAVAWMIRRESEVPSRVSVLHATLPEGLDMPAPQLGPEAPVGHQPSGSRTTSEILLPRGGILAEATGLGKTVEVLACILANRRPILPKLPSVFPEDKLSSKKPSTLLCFCGSTDDEAVKKGVRLRCTDCSSEQHSKCIMYDVNQSSSALMYKCPRCQLRSPPLPSRATLIVVPAKIAMQWADEICNRIVDKEAVRFVTYNGVRWRKYVHPHTLCDKDIILTTYEILYAELDFSRETTLEELGTESERVRSRINRFMPRHSSVTSVEFWRIIFDEAHENLASEILSRLHAVNRWCVTGTPIQHNVGDLFGLFNLIKMELPPYFKSWRSSVSTRCDNGSTLELVAQFKQVIWRTAKSDAAVEDALPPIEEHHHSVSVQPSEQYVYQIAYYNSALRMKELMQRFPDWNLSLFNLDIDSQYELLNRVAEMWHACSHPQTGKPGNAVCYKNLNSMRDAVMQLISDASIRCFYYLNKTMENVFTEASLYLSLDQYETAVTLFRQSKKLWEETSQHVKCCRFIYLHAIACLRVAITTGPQSKDSFVENDELERKENEMKNQFLEKEMCALTTAKKELDEATNVATNCSRKLDRRDAWWMKAAQECAGVDCRARLLNCISRLDANDYSHLTSIFPANLGLSSELLKSVSDSLKAFENAYEKIRGLLASITPMMSDSDGWKQLVLLASRCDECGLECINDGSPCQLCSVRYSVRDCKRAMCLQVNGRSARHAKMCEQCKRFRETCLETVLKVIYECGTEGSPERAEAGSLHLQLLSSQNAQLKRTRTWYRALRNQLLGWLQLDSATRPQKYDAASCLAMLPQLSELTPVLTQKLNAALQKLNYLTSLSKATDAGENDAELDMCLVCHAPLSSNGCALLLSCGHRCCIGCTIHMLAQSAHTNRSSRRPIHADREMLCPLCRAPSSERNLVLVRLRAIESSTVQDDQGAGHLPEAVARISPEVLDPVEDIISSRVRAIVICLEQIISEDPMAKAIVFSHGFPMLKIIGKALKEKGIRFVKQDALRWFGKDLLEKYQEDPYIKVLLLCMELNGSGLSLCNANHVLFAEPVFKPGLKEQVIGHVERLGQKRQVHVHQFVGEDYLNKQMLAFSARMDSSYSSLLEQGIVGPESPTLGDLAALLGVTR